MLREILERIAKEYPAAREEVFASHPLADFIRSKAVTELKAAAGSAAPSLEFKGSAGAGNFASVPWLAVFDPLVTDTATKGYYVVYLFSVDGSAVYLSLNQGTTSTRDEFKSDAPAVLRDRANLMRGRLKDVGHGLSGDPIQLHSQHSLPRGYEEGHALGRKYDSSALPSEDELTSDLLTIISLYRKLTFRGGFDPSPEIAIGDDGLPASATVEEIRRYKMHRRVERNSKAAAQAKKHHGTICQGCGFDFEKRYGEMGKGFIEAHHLRLMSTLAEDVPVKLDVAADFSVLCSNCHRMIHKTEDPSDLQAFKRHLRQLEKYTPLNI